MSGLDHIRTVRVPRPLALEAHAHLQRMGWACSEGFALWAGQAEGDVFHVRRTIIPDQTSDQSLVGTCVIVDGDELHRINVWLYENAMTLIAQIHSHPAEAYHSATDDAYPIVATSGGLSLVVPDFAKDPFSLARCAVYRLTPRQGWGRLSAHDAAKLIRWED